MARSSAYDYQPPSYEEANELSSRRTSTYDGMVKNNGPRYFKARDGDNTIRILPPTWENAKHYSFEVWIHNEIGPDKQSYLCLKENLGKDCPLCEERYSVIAQSESEKLRAKPRNYIYLINRYAEDQGPMIWAISNQSDKEILAQSTIKRTQQYLPIAHPRDGYDVEFSREGAGIKTRYHGFRVSRESSPISENERQMKEWIEYIDDNPIPDVLQYYPYEHIKEVYLGKRDSSSDTATSSRDRRESSNGNDEGPPFDTDDAPSPRRRPPIGGEGRAANTGSTPAPNPAERDSLRRRLRDEQ
jgi:hypothetical protein